MNPTDIALSNFDFANLEEFVPNGTGVYGYQSRSDNPFLSAPAHEESGGTIYFGNDISREHFGIVVRAMGVEENRKNNFLTVLHSVKIPQQSGYLTQVRVVSAFALRFMFGSLSESEYDRFPSSDQSSTDALWAFIESECAHWGTSFANDAKTGLRGLFGGDGNYAREELAFGFMVENQYHGVYRIWSRAWLVTK